MSKTTAPRRASLRRVLFLALAAAALPLGVLAQLGGGSINNVEGTVYADTGWNGTHSGPRNDDVARIDLPRGFREAWNQAPNNAFVQGLSFAADQETILSATAYGPGNSNLTAYDQGGNELWATPPWTDASGFDSCAMVSAAIVDVEGDIYIGDCNQLWAFHPDGQVKWVVDLPLPPAGAPFQDVTAAPVNAITQAWFTKDGSVGGITLWGDIFVVSREDGSPTYEPAQVPGNVGFTLVPTPPTAYLGTVDPELREFVWNWIFATDAFVSADTPSIASGTGRMFVSAKNAAGGNSMYAYDFFPGHGGALGSVELAWEGDLDLTGGSSPAISPDESFVAAGTGEGNVRAFDTETGDVIWNRFDPQAAAGSVSIGPESRTFSIPSTGTAIFPDGTLAWETTDQLDSLTEGLAVHPVLGPPRVQASSILLVIGDKILQSVNVGYSLAAISQPGAAQVRNFVITRDRRTGELVEGSIPFPGRTTLENLTSPHKSGKIMVAYGALQASALQAARPFLDPLLAVVGQTLLPNDPGLQVIEGIDEATLGDLVDGVISDGDFEVDLDARKFEKAVAGHATIGTASIGVSIRRIGHRFKGWVYVADHEADVFGLLFVNTRSLDTGLGPHAAGARAVGKLKIGGHWQRVDTEVLFKDWS